MTERIQAINPIYGMRISICYDHRAKGFETTDLVKIINSISDTRHDYDMLMEAAQFEEVDSFYNPGIEEVSDDFVLEAIVVDKFSKTERRMAAVVRVLNKHLAGSEINALEAIIGKPKKTGSYAYVTVQLPFSDGQVVSVIFHAPEGDKKKIGPSDQIIAFRWLLNKRDITQVVAPEDGSEISLESLATRITQLVIKNSARFERTQKEAQTERQELDKAREGLKVAEERQRELLETMSNVAKDAESIEAKLSNTLALLEKQKSINAELQARLDAMRKTQPNGGTGGKDGTGTEKRGTKPTTTGTDKPAYILNLEDVLAGKYDQNTDKIDTILDQAAEKAEKDGIFAQYEDLFNRAADRLTELFKKKQEAA